MKPLKELRDETLARYFTPNQVISLDQLAQALRAAEQRGIEKGRNEGERYIYGIGAILALSPDLSVGETYRTIKVALTGALATEDGRKAAIYLMDKEAKALAS